MLIVLFLAHFDLLSGIHYRSKLDEFENFVERVSKYGMIPAFIDKDAKSSMILLIDDLPVTNGRVALGRLKNCLYILVRSTQIPTAILFTNYGEADSADHTNLYLEELQLSLESAGACKVIFLKKYYRILFLYYKIFVIPKCSFILI